MGDCRLKNLSAESSSRLQCFNATAEIQWRTKGSLVHLHHEGPDRDSFYIRSSAKTLDLNLNLNPSRDTFLFLQQTISPYDYSAESRPGEGLIRLNTCLFSEEKAPQCDVPLPDSVEIVTSGGYHLHHGKIEECVDECVKTMQRGLGLYYSREAISESLMKTLVTSNDETEIAAVLNEIAEQLDFSLLPQLYAWVTRQTEPKKIYYGIQTIQLLLFHAKKFGIPSRAEYMEKLKSQFPKWFALEDPEVTRMLFWTISNLPELKMEGERVEDQLFKMTQDPKDIPSGKMEEIWNVYWNENLARKILQKIGGNPITNAGDIDPLASQLLGNSSSIRNSLMKKWLQHPNPKVVSFVLRHIDKQSDILNPSIVDRLAQKKDASILKSLARALAYFSEPWSAARLKRWTKSRNDSLASAADFALRQHRSRETMAYLKTILQKTVDKGQFDSPGEETDFYSSLGDFAALPFPEVPRQLIRWMAEAPEIALEIGTFGLTNVPNKLISPEDLKELQTLARQGNKTAQIVLEYLENPASAENMFSEPPDVTRFREVLKNSKSLRNQIGTWLEQDAADTLTEYGGHFFEENGVVVFRCYPPKTWGPDITYSSNSVAMEAVKTGKTLFNGVHFHATPLQGNTQPSERDIHGYNGILVARTDPGKFSVVWFDHFHLAGATLVGDYTYSSESSEGLK